MNKVIIKNQFAVTVKREKNVFYLDKIKNFDKLPKPFVSATFAI